MTNLYIASKESCGKTALCAGIGKKLSGQGKKVGYFAPVRLSDTGHTNGSKDAAFIKEALKLEESPDVLSPVNLSSLELWKSLTDDKETFIQQLKKNHSQLSKGKDIVIMEGLSGFPANSTSTLACYTIAEVLDAKVVVIIRYSAKLAPSDMARAANELGQNLLGVIINFVPESKIEAVKQNIIDSFQKVGIKILGIIPEVKSLQGISIEELAQALNGDIITCPENKGDLIENFMLGAMTLDSGVDYFSRKKDKVAIIRGERPDMQLAALQTPTKCLVLTDNVKPLATVVFESESKHVPLVVAPKDTTGTITDIELALTHSSFHNPQKLKALESILDKYVDLKSLTSALDL
ncbi:AAA family ATPase [Chloroflexota bacterium]